MRRTPAKVTPARRAAGAARHSRATAASARPERRRALASAAPAACCSRRSAASNASGQCSAWATIRVASRSPTPSIATSARCAAATSLPGSSHTRRSASASAMRAERLRGPAREARLDQRRHTRIGDPPRVGREPSQPAHLALDRLPQRLHQAPRRLAGREPGPAGQEGAQHCLDPVERAWDAEPRPPRDPAPQAPPRELRVHHRRLGVEIEQPPEPGQQRHQRRHQCGRHQRLEVVPGRARVRDGEHAGLPIHPHGAVVAAALDQLDPRQRIPRDGAEQRRPVERRTVREGETDALAAGRRRAARVRARTPPERARAQPVALAEQRVEPAQALEAARVGDAGHRQRGVRQEPLGQQQAMGLRQLERRHAQLALEHPSEVAVAHPQLARELPDPAAVERSGADPVGRHPGEPRHRVDDRAPRRQLGPAAETGPEPGPLGGRGRIEEAPALVVRDPRRTDRPAIDPRGRDPDEEDPVEPGIPGVEGALADGGAEQGRRDDDSHHARNLRRGRLGGSPESDV